MNLWDFKNWNSQEYLGVGQHLERPNVERPIFRYFGISKSRILK